MGAEVIQTSLHAGGTLAPDGVVRVVSAAANRFVCRFLGLLEVSCNLFFVGEVLSCEITRPSVMLLVLSIILIIIGLRLESSRESVYGRDSYRNSLETFFKTYY